ncbi:MAG: Ca2+-dependent phosphoinositide-specific phospholipase C, partial [Bacteroidota bacterium]
MIQSSMTWMFRFFVLLFCLLSFQGVSQFHDSTRLNEIRVLASHNSYKKKPDSKVLRFLYRFKKQLGASNDPIQLDYGHLLLSEQFDKYGVRGIEIDINYDPKGGLYSKRKLNLFVPGIRQRVKDKRMNEPGFKVLHIADVDYETNYLTFKDVLNELKKWSENHPNHTPLFVNIEAKGSNPGDESKFLRKLGFKKAIQFDSLAYQELDQELFSVLSQSTIFSPSNLKGNYSSIQRRIESENWPRVSDCLGKIIFILEGNNEQIYRQNPYQHPMFVYGNSTNEHTAFVLRNDPIGNENEILELTKNFIVRTRSDAGTIEARNNDYTRFNSAWKSGAQIISTDYYRPDL